VHFPDLSQLESDVRNQITTQQNSLAATVKDPNVTNAKLSAAYGAMGEVYHAYSLTAPARECYANANRLAPNDPKWIYLLAKLDQLEGRVDEAIRRFQTVTSLNPQLLAAHVNLGNIYLELNRLDDAARSFSAALEIEKQNPAAHYGLGQVALSRRLYAEAVAHFEKALASAPDANRIHYALAMAYRGLPDQAKAKTHLAQQGPVGVRVADPLMDQVLALAQSVRLYLIRGKQALEAKRYDDAAAEFRKAIAANPESVPAHVNLGAALTQLGDLNGAAEEFQKSLVIDPANTNAHYNLAVVLANKNDHAGAIVHFKAVANSNPNDLNARFLLGQQLLKTNRFDEALVEFSYVAQTDSNNEEALLERARLLQKAGQQKEALDSLEKAHAQFPQKIKTTAMLTYLLAASPQAKLRDGNRALKLAQSLYAATGSLQHGQLIGLALSELNRCDEAAELQQKLLALAVQQNNEEMASKLKADLQRSKSGSSCRPAGDW
jgi:tetratricopeptide (TPR) repeat protein